MVEPHPYKGTIKFFLSLVVCKYVNAELKKKKNQIAGFFDYQYLLEKTVSVSEFLHRDLFTKER